ncbi:MAG TPA: hypothetical protein ENN99_15705 [Chloroflexi bacterium]|nr:hypothetical protein [Chloroflexota bacterium]
MQRKETNTPARAHPTPSIRFWSLGVALVCIAVAVGWTTLQLNLLADGCRCRIVHKPAPGCMVREDLTGQRTPALVGGGEELQPGDMIVAAAG